MSYLKQLEPFDEFNQTLQANVHPLEWSNPKPAGRYNLVVIGAGTAGLVTAAGAAGLGAKVALIERGLMGGDCLNVGCVPSKALIAAGRAAAACRRANQFGIRGTENITVDFSTVMQRLRKLRARISLNDSAQRFSKLGVDVYFGQARFVDSNTVEVDGALLRFKRAVIATGARAAAPDLPGLDTVHYLTNENLFALTELPRRLGVIGAGPIGCEMAQTFSQLGSEVFLFETEHGVLPREDRDAADIVQQAMLDDGMTLRCCSKQLRIRNENGMRLSVQSHGHTYDEAFDQILVSVGRTPNTENLNLEGVGVDYHAKGVVVNERMQTTNPQIYAAGDICSEYQFTHAADYLARIVIQNSLFLGRKKSSSLVIPWCTYTSPEIAHVGLSERGAKESNVDIDTYVQKFHDVDRAVLDGEENGFVKIHTRRGSDKILGATIVASSAGDLISEVTLAISRGVGLGRFASVIHPYPTQADAIRKLGDQYNRTKLTPFVKSMFGKWLSWTR